MDTLGEHGADLDGIAERFLGDEAFYVECLIEFMQDQNFEALEKAIEIQNYTEAFEQAHALKGVAGNLGLMPLYRALSDVISALKAKEYDDLELLYQTISSYHALYSGLLK